MEELRPIKPLLDIPDMSFWVLFGVIALVSLLVFVLLVIAITKWWSARRENLTKKYLAILKQTNWSNPKQAAYSVTHYGRLVANDRRSQEIYEQLLVLLKPYKYKKNIPKLDKKVLHQFELFMQVLDG